MLLSSIIYHIICGKIPNFFFIFFSLINSYALCTVNFYTAILAITKSDFLLWTDNGHHQQHHEKSIGKLKTEIKQLQLKIFFIWTKQLGENLEFNALTTMISLSMAAKSVIINLLKPLHNLKFHSSLPALPALTPLLYGPFTIFWSQQFFGLKNPPNLVKDFPKIQNFSELDT